MIHFPNYCPGLALLVPTFLACTSCGFSLHASEQHLQVPPSADSQKLPKVVDACHGCSLRVLSRLLLTINTPGAAFHALFPRAQVSPASAASTAKSHFGPVMAVVPLLAAKPAASLSGLSLPRVGDGELVDVGAALASATGKTMLVLGTYAADFNMIEIAQRVRCFWPQLQEKGVTRCMMVINGNPPACSMLAKLLDLPEEIEILSDPEGEAGRRFGVSRGWRPDDAGLSPLLKLTVVGLGWGPPWMTLPAVLPGYFGDPNGRREWIEESLKQGQLAGRWPSVLELAEDGSLKRNKFDDFPLLGSWGRRPLELATLRLQNLVSIQFKHWNELKPTDDRCLTQLGGCTVVGPSGEPIYSWIDQGLCDIADMYEVLGAL